MLLGVLYGILATVIQPFAYLFSRIYVVRGGRPAELTIHSQVIMGGLSALILLGFRHEVAFTAPVLGRSLLSVITILIAQVCYFFAVRVVETSRLTTMLSLKTFFLVLLNMALFRQFINPMQFLAVLLCVAAVFVMNFSGLRISLKALALILVSCFFLASSDIADYLLFTVMPHRSMLADGIMATGYCYLMLGVISLPGLFFVGVQPRKMLLALPYACAWLLSMMVFFVCLGYLGTVHTTIIQSFRGLFSVLLGVVVSWLGFTAIETKNSWKIWLLRGVAAALITTSVLLYGAYR